MFTLKLEHLFRIYKQLPASLLRILGYYSMKISILNFQKLQVSLRRLGWWKPHPPSVSFLYCFLPCVFPINPAHKFYLTFVFWDTIKLVFIHFILLNIVVKFICWTMILQTSWHSVGFHWPLSFGRVCFDELRWVTIVWVFLLLDSFQTAWKVLKLSSSSITRSWICCVT